MDNKQVYFVKKANSPKPEGAELKKKKSFRDICKLKIGYLQNSIELMIKVQQPHKKLHVALKKHVSCQFF